jgi:hypothetical protein
MNEQINSWGEMPRDFARENLGVTPIFALEKIVDEKTGATGFIEVVSLRIAGDTLSEVLVPVDDAIKERFEAEYSAWKAGADPNGGKTPLASWGVLNTKQIAELQRININFVEDVAALSDSNVSVLGVNPQRLRDRAIAFLSCGGDSLTLRQLQAENRAMKSEIAELRALVTAKRKVSK